jgi:L-alanine-DL-glutamate epimerase-like enolase superfamily enzyme
VKITQVEPFILHVPLGRHIEDSVNRVDEWGLPGVLIHTDAGIVGTGYTSTHTYNDRQIFEVIRDYYGPVLLGQDPMRTQYLWDRMFWSKAHWAGRMGITTMAQAAVDIALWDLKARAVGLPLWRLLGGHKDTVKSYNTDGGWLNLSVQELIQQMGGLLEAGWTGVKMKVGHPDPREDVKRVRAVRQALGNDFDLMIDANQYWDLTTARTWVPRFEEFQITWLEEPLAPDDVRSHALLAASTRIPIAVGEHLYSPVQFRDFILANAVQYIQVDCTRVGGITPWLEVAALAHAFNISVVPHHADMMRVHQHLAAASPASPMMECILWLQELFVEPLDIRGGVFHLSDTPGASTSMNPEKFQEFRVA